MLLSLMVGVLTGGPSAVAAAPMVTAVLSGSGRHVDPWTLGLNGENTGGPSYATPGFADSVASYGPGSLRYPGGTSANFWSWSTGWYQPNGPWPGQPAKQVDTTLSTFASIVRRTGAVPVFDVNLVTWKGRIATDSDVPAMIADTLALLRAAVAAGVPVQRVELGNELYLPGPSPGTTQYQARFATAAQYAAVADRYATAITQAFPQAHVAAVAAVVDDVNSISARRRQWNSGLLPNLHATPSVTLHLNVRVHDPSSTPADVIGVMVRQIRDLAANELPLLHTYGLDAWVTEFNMADQTPGSVFERTWLHGVAVGTLALSLLGQPGVEQLAMHNVTGRVGAAIFPDAHGFGASGPTTTPYALTASGTVLGFVQDALRGAASAQPLAFPNAPPLGAQGAPGLLGLLVTAGTQRRVVLLNLTGQVLTVDVSGVVNGAFSYRRAWAGTATTVVAGPTDVQRDSGTATGPMSLPAYGVALITH